MTLQKRTWKEVDGVKRLVPLEHDPITCYATRIPFMTGSGMQFVTAMYTGKWYVYEYATGLVINTEGCKTQAKAVKAATKKIELHGKEHTTKVFKEQKAILL
jgi:hypothetical protein